MKLGNISYRAWHIWYRNWESFRMGWLLKLLPPIVEPVIYILAFGYGMGSLVGPVPYQGATIKYLNFMAPGMLGVTIMFWAFFETTYGTYVRMEFQKTFKATIATPLLWEDIVVGEWLWGASKAVIATLIMVGMLAMLGLVEWRTAAWIAPITVVSGLLFSSMGMITAALSPSIDMFNVPVFIFITPMFVFSGTFFPIEVLPRAAKIAAYTLPLTHVSELLRGSSLGILPTHWLLNVIYVLVSTAAFSYWSFRVLYRRLSK